MRRCLLTALACLLLPGAARAADLAQYVDPMIGTLAPGFVFPGADAPFGMVQNSPDTLGPLVYSGYMGNDPAIRGFSLVHLSRAGRRQGRRAAVHALDRPTGAPPTDPMQYARRSPTRPSSAEAGYYEVRLANGTRRRADGVGARRDAALRVPAGRRPRT